MIQFYKFNCLLAASVVAISLISCEEKDNNYSAACNTEEDIIWLEEAIDDIRQDEYSYYVQANYNDETVFYYVNCNPLINYASIVLNCNGDNLGNTNDLLDELSDMIIIWEHEDSKCN